MVSSASTDIISLVKIGCPLLVVWLYIRTKENVIEWATASESNSDRFEIISSEGECVATIKAAGNTSQSSYYSTRVKDGFYVIKEIDIDGNFTYSKIVRVRGDRQSEYEYVGIKYNILGQKIRQ